MLINRIAILGGTGFVGHSLCNRLAREGYKLKVLTRNREYNRDNLILLPELDLVETNIHDPNQLEQQTSDCDVVINLVGILNEKGNNGSGFEHVHVSLVEKLLHACEKNGIKRLLQMSALNADAENGKSHYLRTKGKAEDILHSNTSGVNVTSFRPSVIFGRDDSFFNRFANLLKISPLFFPLACHDTKFAPVYVLDVVEIMVRSLTDPESYDKKYQLCGPKVYSLKELVEYTANVMDLNRTIIPLNDILSRIQATIFDFVPGKPFSTDNYLSAKTDSICEGHDLAMFGIETTPIESIVPRHLKRKNFRSNYSIFRSASRRQ